ncbi:helix-turn-helix domain-containing protein [Aliiglaciecola sp. LCG003]|uniref:helix-turn-helix domain-containing protein n=1 Tax=Aliiglaciecola sp. LCG003 TaxID=3053655 RepID=UPI00257317A0|nr:helix-turn-helix domain-containing protein [Aliiglaciecola sp. LCG003]WJG09033.1 helix-turn-helix domain-containing protein [Aliiglaciecola sp. LCG003]
MDNMSLYQITIIVMLVGWFVALILIWVRFDSYPHGKLMLTGILLWPLLMIDEWLKLSGYFTALSFLIGLFQFVPAIIAATLVLSVRRLTVEKVAANHLLFFLPAVIMLVAQIPVMILPTQDKISMLFAPPIGDLLGNWPIYAAHLLSAFIILGYAVHSAEYFGSYHYHLSDQVVDVDIYQMKFAANACWVLIVVAFIDIAILTVVAFDLLPIGQWNLLCSMLNAAGLLLLQLVLLEKRRYSPTPFSDHQLSHKAFTDDYLRHALKQAEVAIIRNKAYKRKGLRIRQLADAAEIEPAALAMATRFILKRNFRAFIYHYRLEYAKKILMRTDQKVTTVAKRLGFNSEKYLSEMFVKYISVMGSKSTDDKDIR